MAYLLLNLYQQKLSEIKMVRDSGLTDSQFVKAQKFKNSKTQTQIQIINEEANQLDRERFKQKLNNNPNNDKDKLGLWNMITGLFR